MSDLFVAEGVVVQFAHLHHPVQVHVEELEHHVKSVVMPDHLQARDYVLVLQPNHGFNFGVTHSGLPGSELSLERLQCVYLLSLFVSHLINDSEATLSQRLQHPKALY